jgi:hypothetical protein
MELIYVVLIILIQLSVYLIPRIIFKILNNRGGITDADMPEHPTCPKRPINNNKNGKLD